MKVSISNITIVVLTAVVMASCTKSKYSSEEIESMRNQIKEFAKADSLVQQHLATFDTLDYVVFSNQEWTRLHESHSKDVKVYWPDGHVTQGIDVHIEDLSKLFVYAPDTRIKVHPIRFGTGNLTAVSGVFEGTFTQPMPIGDGKFIQPTGKAFKMPMATIGLWGEDGTMYEEHLFWDNQTYVNQIGLGK